jgi:hypothetical protein
MYAIKDISPIRSIRLFKSLISFSYIQFRHPISSFLILLAARFPLLFLLNIIFSYSVEDDGLFERRKILRE